jgi:enhancer of yellow 2 transcription factor
VESGEKARLKALLRDKLIQCGWRDELRARCNAIVQSRGSGNVTAAELQREIAPIGRAKVPDNIKAELLAQIRAFILSQ